MQGVPAKAGPGPWLSVIGSIYKHMSGSAKRGFGPKVGLGLDLGGPMVKARD